MLEKLAEAREAQSRAMQRFAQARARVSQVETRLQALRERLGVPRPEVSETEAPQQDTSKANIAINRPVIHQGDGSILGSV